MPDRLKDKVVLITGASKGIGAALAVGCAREGADVIINYRSDRGGAEDVAEQVENLGRRALVAHADIASVAQIERMFARARKAFPRLDVLINNAGVTGWGEAMETTEAKWDHVMDVNLKGTFFCSIAAARWMRETKTAGAIVNISSNTAALAVPNLVAYATSKAGLHGLTAQLAVELAPDGIRVNAFAPGATNVDRNLRDDPDYAKVWGSVIPLGRTAGTDDMIGPAVFLASDESRFVTGQVFYVDGGWSCLGSAPEAYIKKAARKNR